MQIKIEGSLSPFETDHNCVTRLTLGNLYKTIYILILLQLRSIDFRNVDQKEK